MRILEITVKELNAFLKMGDDVTIIDVREPWEIDIAKLPRAINIPLATLSDNLSAIPDSGRVVISCHSGRRSMNACLYLHSKGFTNTVNLKGGIEAWSKEIDESIPLY